MRCGRIGDFLCVRDVGMDLQINETDAFSTYDTTTVMCTIKRVAGLSGCV